MTHNNEFNQQDIINTIKQLKVVYLGEWEEDRLAKNIAIQIIEQYRKEHPIKTYLSDFLEKYLNAELKEDGTPKNICPSDLGFEDIDKKEHCCNRCVECWNQKLEE